VILSVENETKLKDSNQEGLSSRIGSATLIYRDCILGLDQSNNRINKCCCFVCPNFSTNIRKCGAFLTLAQKTDLQLLVSSIGSDKELILSNPKCIECGCDANHHQLIEYDECRLFETQVKNVLHDDERVLCKNEKCKNTYKVFGKDAVTYYPTCCFPCENFETCIKFSVNQHSSSSQEDRVLRCASCGCNKQDHEWTRQETVLITEQDEISDYSDVLSLSNKLDLHIHL